MKSRNGARINGNTLMDIILFFIFSGSAARRGLLPPRFTRFLDHTRRSATVGRNSLGRVISPSQNLYLTKQHTQQTNIHAPVVGIRTHDRSRRAAVDLSLRSRGHWDRPDGHNTVFNPLTPELNLSAQRCLTRFFYWGFCFLNRAFR
jgi:hypothetical protein